MRDSMASCAPSEVEQTRDVSRTTGTLLVVTSVGIAAIVVHALPAGAGIAARAIGTALLSAAAAWIAGAFLGFLFGVPRRASPYPADSLRPPAEEERAFVGSTGIEQIADWLTKIIIGASIAQAVTLARAGKEIAARLADDLALSGGRSFAAALLVFFSICGFFFGYLVPRLSFPAMFTRADQIGTHLRTTLDEEANRLSAGTRDPEFAVTPAQIAAAERIERMVSPGSMTLVRRQVLELAREYERIRASMSFSNERTRRLDRVATKMRTLALAAEPLVPELRESSSAGERLAAIMILQVRPSVECLAWLAERVGKEKPFIGYHAAVALVSAARLLGPERERVVEAIGRATEALGSSGDEDTKRALAQARHEVDSGEQRKPAAAHATT